MSKKWSGGIITATPTAPTIVSASGIWTLDQQRQAQNTGAWPIAGPVYIEDTFSTYLYTGTGSAQTITNGVNLSAYGGLVWLKSRSLAQPHWLFDTSRGIYKYLKTTTTDNENTSNTSLTAFNSTGFSIGNDTEISTNGATQVSWTFREQPKFFDVVTWTGNSVQGRQISHSLGSTPGCIITKCTSIASNWTVYHRSLTANYILQLSSTTPQINVGSPNAYVSAPTDTTFIVGNDADVNSSGATYVAYLFAHDAGGFGLTGTDNVISCGTFTTDASGDATVTLGYEPQWALVKRSNGVENWTIVDSMRGIGLNSAKYSPIGIGLYPNLSNAESNANILGLNATGFTTGQSITSSATYIYIAIRRGPMKVPTLGTSVFDISARTGTGANATVTGGTGVDDAVLIKNRGSAIGDLFASRLTGVRYLETSATTAEVSAGVTILQANPWDVMDGVKVGTTSTITNASANTFINYLFSRASGFFDVVPYTGTGSVLNVSHNLVAIPELMIVKARSTGSNWGVYNATSGPTRWIKLQDNSALEPLTTPSIWNDTAPTSSVFSLCDSAASDSSVVNTNGVTYVAYLFATCAGVSKVGSYTGTGTTLQINCGFASGARFIVIKRTDSTGDWYYWDSTRGIIAGNDPYLLLNSTAAEVTSTDYIDTYNAGFEISSTAPAAINASAGTFIFLAIA